MYGPSCQRCDACVSLPMNVGVPASAQGDVVVLSLALSFVCDVAALPREKSSSQSPRPEGIGIGPAHATSKLGTKTPRGVPQSRVQELSYKQ